jgi:beta-lactamase class D
MKFFLLLLLAVACSSESPVEKKNDLDEQFTNLRGCFLLYNVKESKIVKEWGEDCYEKYPAASTFKVPLAVMAFDSGVLKNEEEIIKWDGEKRWLDHWNKDQNARTWMQYSVVWVSQELTPKIGEKKLKKYLHDFSYGNEEITDIREAWLERPTSKKPALKISAREQLEFMKKLWAEKLPVSQRSMSLTKEIMALETSPKGYNLAGKTGSNFYDDEKKFQLGWFIAHLEKGGEEYISVMTISDLAPYHGASFGGMRAKDITKKIFAHEGLW